MPGPICIITPTGTRICEAPKSYDGDLRSRKKKKARIPKTFGGRVVKLMKLANVKHAPFEIVARTEKDR
jgi:hypothetical protein